MAFRSVSCTRFSGLHELESRSGLGNSGRSSHARQVLASTGVGQRFSRQHVFGAGSIGGRPRDDDDDDDAEINETASSTSRERGKERLGPERVERLERLNEKRKVHAAHVREAGKGSEFHERAHETFSVGLRLPRARLPRDDGGCCLWPLLFSRGPRPDVGALLRVVKSMTGTHMFTVVSSGAGTFGVASRAHGGAHGASRGPSWTIAATPYIARKLGWRPGLL